MDIMNYNLFLGRIRAKKTDYKQVSFFIELPELISILVTGALHLWKRQMLLSIAGGTVCYMLLLHFLF